VTHVVLPALFLLAFQQSPPPPQDVALCGQAMALATHYKVENFPDGKPKGICSGTGGPNQFCIWVGFWDKDTKACDGIDAP